MALFWAIPLRLASSVLLFVIPEGESAFVLVSSSSTSIERDAAAAVGNPCIFYLFKRMNHLENKFPFSPAK
jgi:hypothetical protein